MSTIISQADGLEQQPRVSSVFLRPGFMLAMLANIIWGSSFLASKYTLQAWGPFTASSLRFGIATIVLYAALCILGRKIQTPRSTSNSCQL